MGRVRSWQIIFSRKSESNPCFFAGVFGHSCINSMLYFKCRETPYLWLGFMTYKLWMQILTYDVCLHFLISFSIYPYFLSYLVACSFASPSTSQREGIPVLRSVLLHRQRTKSPMRLFSYSVQRTESPNPDASVLLSRSENRIHGST